jgi:hypothetical protein
MIKNENWEYNLNNNTIQLSRYIGQETKKIIIPPTFFNVPVTIVGTGCFAFHDYIKEVELPNTIRVIGRRAFMCTNITKIIMPNMLLEISIEAFCNCISLNEVVLNFGLIKIGDKAFYGCRSLENIEIPNSVIEFGMQSFSNCHSNLNSKQLVKDMQNRLKLISQLNSL